MITNHASRSRSATRQFGTASGFVASYAALLGGAVFLLATHISVAQTLTRIPRSKSNNSVEIAPVSSPTSDTHLATREHAYVRRTHYSLHSEVSPATAPDPHAPNSTSVPRPTRNQLHAVKIYGYRAFASQVIPPVQLANSSQPAESVTKSMINLLGPEAGGPQALSILPNVYVAGYNNYSETGRSQISLRGIKVGYNSIPGDLQSEAVTVELDGVPLNSMGEFTDWHSPEVPIGALMAGENVIVGPGNPSERWYASLGGTIDFIPVQPTAIPGGDVEVAGGSDQTLDDSAVYNTGAIDGWSTVFGIASARSLSFRTSQFNLPSDTEEAYIKTRKIFSHGSSVSFGAYYQRNHEWRPNMIPLRPVPLVDTAGLGIGAPYSEQTSGFYATLPRSLWHKEILIQNWLLWSHMHFSLSRSLKLSNMTWIRIGKDWHYRVTQYSTNPSSPYYSGSPENVEYYVQSSKTLGDRVTLRERFNRKDTLSVGGYVVTSLANEHLNEYSTFSKFDGSTLEYPQQGFLYGVSSFYSAAFVQDDFRPLPQLKIVPGFRVVQYESMLSNRSESAACIELASLNNGNCPVVGNSYTVNGNTFQFLGYPTFPDQELNFVETEPSIGANYELVRGLHLFGNFSITRHPPNASRTLSTFPIDIQTLKPGQSEEYDFGIRFVKMHLGILHDVYASLDFFHNLMTHETFSYTTAEHPLTIFFGNGSGVYKGADLSFQGRMGEHWNGFVNVGYLQARWNQFRSPVTPSGKEFTGAGLPVSNSPKYTVNAGLGYLFRLPGARVHAMLWDQYTGARYLFDVNTGSPTNVPEPAFNLVNFSVSLRTHLIPGTRDDIISVQAINLANTEYNSTEYISSGGYFGTPTGGYIIGNPGAPRMLFASLRAEF